MSLPGEAKYKTDELFDRLAESNTLSNLKTRERMIERKLFELLTWVLLSTISESNWFRLIFNDVSACEIFLRKVVSLVRRKPLWLDSASRSKPNHFSISNLTWYVCVIQFVSSCCFRNQIDEKIARERRNKEETIKVQSLIFKWAIFLVSIMTFCF